jgi:hypothetical protein
MDTKIIIGVIVAILILVAVYYYYYGESIVSGYPRKKCPPGYSWFPPYGECIPTAPSYYVRG